MPTRALAAWQAVTMTMVSPERTMTAPSACLANLPVSIESVRAPSVISRRWAVGIMKTQRAKDKRQRALRQSTAGARRRSRSLLADAELADQLRVPIGILPLEIVEQTPALAHQLQEAAPRVMVLDVRFEVLGEVV